MSINKKSFESKIPLPVKWPTMTHSHSPHEAEDDEALQIRDREMGQRENEGPRSLDFFLLGNKREKKRRQFKTTTRDDMSRDEITLSLEDERRRLDRLRKVEKSFSSLAGEEDRHEAQRKREAVSPRRGQAGRQRELILSPLAYHSQMWKPQTDYREHQRTWEVSGHLQESVGLRSPTAKKITDDFKQDRLTGTGQAEHMKRQNMGGQIHSRELGGHVLSASSLENQRLSEKRDEHPWTQRSESQQSHGALVQELKAQFEKHKEGDDNLTVPTHQSGPHCLNIANRPTSDLPELNVGDRVVISGQQHGVLQYLGPAHFQAGLWCGIELDSGVGLHGGCVGGVEYFCCRDNHGIFAPVWKVEPEVPEPALPSTSLSNQRFQTKRMDFSRPGHNLGGSGLSGGSGSKSATAGADVKSQKGFFAKAKNSALSHIKSRVRMNIQPPTQRFSLHAQHGGSEANEGHNITTTGCGSPETPDIVSSCDRRSDAGSDETGSKRNSVELDESLGILSPGEMRDFTASSMTQSLASVSSLPRDTSWDELNTDTTDNTVTEDYTDSADKTSYDDSEADSSASRARLTIPSSTSPRSHKEKYVTRTAAAPSSSYVCSTSFTRDSQIPSRAVAGSRITRPSQNKTFNNPYQFENRSEGNKSQIRHPLSQSEKAVERKSLKTDLFDSISHTSPPPHSNRMDHLSSMSDIDLGYLPSRGTPRSEQRFCLDSSKLEEIEALTCSPIPHLEVPHILADVDISPPLSESLPKSETKEIDSVSQLLFERTESLLQKSPRKNRNKEQKLIKCDKMKHLEMETKIDQSKALISKELGKFYLNEEGVGPLARSEVNLVNKFSDIDQVQIRTREAWSDFGQSAREEITKLENEKGYHKESKCRNEDINLSPAGKRSYFEDHLRDTELKEISKQGGPLLVSPALSDLQMHADSGLSEDKHSLASRGHSSAVAQPISDADKQNKSADLALSGCITEASSNSAIETAKNEVTEREMEIFGDASAPIDDICDETKSEVIECLENVLVINKHLCNVKQGAESIGQYNARQGSDSVSCQSKHGSDLTLNIIKPGGDSMAESVTGKSEADSLSQDLGIASMSSSMPSSMISSNSMVLSFANEMDSSGFFSDIDGRTSTVNDGDEFSLSNKTQISPITENSEPDSHSEAGSQYDQRSSLQFKSSEDTNAFIVGDSESHPDDFSFTSASSIEASETLAAGLMEEQTGLAGDGDRSAEEGTRQELRGLTGEIKKLNSDLEAEYEEYDSGDVVNVIDPNCALPLDSKRRKNAGCHISDLEPEEKKLRKRSQEKGLATKRSELLQDKPIVPNKNVGSKLKAMLTENEVSLKSREPRVRKPSRWDAVMNKIEQGKTDVKPIKEVKSKVFANFVPPSLPVRKLSYHNSSSIGSSPRENLGSQNILSPRNAIAPSEKSLRNKLAPFRQRSSTPESSVGENFSLGRDLQSSRPGSSFAGKNAISSRSSSMVSTGSMSSTGQQRTSRSNSVISEVPPLPSRSNSNISSASTRSSVSKNDFVGYDPAPNKRKTSQKGFAKPVAPATSVCRVSKAQTSKVAVTSNLKRRPGLASTRRQPDDKTPSIVKQGGRPPTSRDENRAPPPHPRLLRGHRPQEGVQVSQQPDLVKFSASKSAQHAEIDRLENLLDSKNKDLEKVRNIVKENAQGFDVMAVVLNQMSIKTCLTSKLQNMVAQLSKEVEVANLQIVTKEEAHKDLEERHSKELLNFQSSMQLLKSEHENNQRELNEKHFKEIQKHKEDTQTVIHKKKLIHEEDIVLIMNKHKEEVISLEQNHTDMIESLKSKFTDQEAKLRSNFSDEKSSLDGRISELNTKIKTLEDNLMHGSDYRMKNAQNKMTNLQQEIDSLKTVVEMRTSEVHELRTEKVKLEEKLEIFDQQQISIKKFTAQVEDLKEQLTAKCDIEQKIMEENRHLHQLVQKENFEKKRLSMENEQLSWKMNQGKEYSMLNTSEDSSYLTCLDGPLSMSYCEGTTCSLPVMGSPRFTRGGRPMSAPPGKLTQSIFDDSRSLPPDSPRVLEVVEKSESVSWKLEYESLMSAESSPSPSTKRKLSPQSPLMLRKCKSSGLMTRSLDMSLNRSNSYTSGTDHTTLHRTQSLIQRNGSIRRKIIPSFETLSESTESESDDSKKSSPVEFNDKQGNSKQNSSVNEINNQRIEMTTPAPVDIAGSDDEMCEISSSSEIEIGEEQDVFNQQDESSESEPGSPDTEPEVTLRSELTTCTVLNKSVGGR